DASPVRRGAATMPRRSVRPTIWGLPTSPAVWTSGQASVETGTGRSPAVSRPTGVAGRGDPPDGFAAVADAVDLRRGSGLLGLGTVSPAHRRQPGPADPL